MLRTRAFTYRELLYAHLQTQTLTVLTDIYAPVSAHLHRCQCEIDDDDDDDDEEEDDCILSLHVIMMTKNMMIGSRSFEGNLHASFREKG